MNAVRSAGGGGRPRHSFKLDHENPTSPNAIIRPTCTISELMKKTNFSREEIQHYYRTFKQDCPSGEVTKSHFASIFATLFPSGECFRYATFLFQNIDRSNKGLIRFEDLLVTLSILLHGSIEDRISWIFDLYDINKDGILTKTELTQIIASIFQLIAPVCKVNFTSVTNAIEERTDQLFQTWDINGTGCVSKSDFLRYCLQNDTIRYTIDQFKPTQ